MCYLKDSKNVFVSRIKSSITIEFIFVFNNLPFDAAGNSPLTLRIPTNLIKLNIVSVRWSIKRACKSSGSSVMPDYINLFGT